MHIEQELEEWLASHIPANRQDKIRNTKAILSYYGFGELACPTLEEISQQLSFGTRERVRQVKKEHFKNSVELQQLPVATRIFEILQSHGFAPVPKIREQLAMDGLASERTTLKGLLRLARDLNACEGYDLYDSSLKKLRRAEAESDRGTFLVREDTLARLKKNLKVAERLPGLLGLARFEYLRSELGDGVETDRIMQLVRATPSACIIRDEGDEWYVFEDRDNTLINNCEKAYSLTTDQYKLSVLAETLQNSLRKRSHKGKYDYPRAELISAWIERSRWFLVENETARFRGRSRQLTPIETGAVAYLRDRDSSNYSEFKDHLLDRFGENAVRKVITESPLVTVDKTRGRKHHTYQLIEKAAKVEDDVKVPVSRYQLYKNRLKEVLTAGTDSIGKSIVRQEQSLLREWLFGDREVCACAICGEEFSVTALVTAHKKKRKLCNDSERTDPDIVFPLCKLGCDYLYEIGLLRIEDGVVQMSETPPGTTDGKRARELAGRKIDEKWLLGDEAYFSGNSTG